MSKTTLVYSCAHADPSVGNERFEWLGKFIYDLKPDMVIDLGDGADMRSLNVYDKNKPGSLVMQNYEEDVESYLDAQEKLRHPFRLNKKKRPTWIGFEGNHEHRIEKALELDPRLKGSKHGISFSHLQTERFFDEYHRYVHSAPAIVSYDGVLYSHFFSSGNYGAATAGVHHAYTLLQNNARSSTCGHSHKRGIYFKDGTYPRGIIGCVVGCYKGKEEAWAGQANREWAHGVMVKHEVEDGMYDPQWVSMEYLRKKYS